MNILVCCIAIFALSRRAVSQKIAKSQCKQYGKFYSEKSEGLGILPLIIGGVNAVDKEFPFMALIGFGEENVRWLCGGTLISEKYVISAAHCSHPKEYGIATRIKFGLRSRNDTGDNIQERKISKVVLHPKYKHPLKYHDIGLFKLDSPIKLTSHVRPACLNYKKDFLNKTKTVIAIGFGKTSFDDDNGSEDLQKVELPILETSSCDHYYFSMRKTTLKTGLTKDHICAGFLAGGKDTCQGDSGGPLFVPGEYPILVGITSFGRFCGFAKSPAIYTKIYNYVPWIETIVWKL